LAKPTIQYIVEEAHAAGADEVLVVVSEGKRAIRDHFSADPQLAAHLSAVGKPGLAEMVEQAGSLPVTFVLQDRPLGLGHAVLCAREHVTDPAEPIYILLGDVIVPGNLMLPRMLEVSRAHQGASVIAVTPVPADQTERFGVIAGEPLDRHGEPDVWRITDMVEKPKSNPPSNLAIFGRYLLTPTIMAKLALTPPSAGGEIQLTDAMVCLLESEEVYALVIDAADGHDVGTIEDWLKANIAMAASDPSYPQLGLGA
jgi:UTP--glucose-1-phosphate uridylyltransferase